MAIHLNLILNLSRMITFLLYLIINRLKVLRVASYIYHCQYSAIGPIANKLIRIGSSCCTRINFPEFDYLLRFSEKFHYCYSICENSADTDTDGVHQLIG